MPALAPVDRPPPPPDEDAAEGARTDDRMREAASRVYTLYQTQFSRRFRWLRPGLFRPALKKHLLEDARALVGLLDCVGTWRSDHDAKLAALRAHESQFRTTMGVALDDPAAPAQWDAFAARVRERLAEWGRFGGGGLAGGFKLIDRL